MKSKRYIYNKASKSSIGSKLVKASLLVVAAFTVIATVSSASPTKGTFAQGGTPSTTTVTPVVNPANCVAITTFSNKVGYYSVWSAIWTSFNIDNKCGTALNWRMDYTDPNGVVVFSRSTSTQYMSSGVIDEDWADFSTTYNVSLTVSASDGSTLASTSGLVTTKAPKDVVIL